MDENEVENDLNTDTESQSKLFLPFQCHKTAILSISPKPCSFDRWKHWCCCLIVFHL